MDLAGTDRWKQAWPGAMVGVIGLRQVVNPEVNAALQGRTEEVEAQLRARFSRTDRTGLAAVPALQAYARYYKRFDKTYHVRLQLESVVFKGKPIVSPTAIIQTMFVMELKNLLLTAVHDLDLVRGSLTVDAAEGTESYQVLGGGQQVLRRADMYLRDEAGILSSILYGSDWRTRITPEAKSAIFTTYAPEGISRDELEMHLTDLETTVRLYAPEAAVETRRVLTAG